MALWQATEQTRKQWRRLLRNPRFLFGLVVVAIIVLMALSAGVLAPYELSDRDIASRLCAPSRAHPFGCDLDGADVLTTMLYGARTSLYVGFLTVALSLTLGVFIGLVSGFWGGWIDITLMRFVDIIMAFPGILLALTLTTLIGPATNTIIFAIAATGWTSSARLARGEVLSLREREYVLASRALGARVPRLMFHHILPGLLSPLIVHATFSLSAVIVVEAGLSFLGLGSQDKTMTWGALLGQGTKVDLSQAPHLAVIPGAAIFLLVIALNFMGDALRDTFDPKAMRRS